MRWSLVGQSKVFLIFRAFFTYQGPRRTISTEKSNLASWILRQGIVVKDKRCLKFLATLFTEEQLILLDSISKDRYVCPSILLSRARNLFLFLRANYNNYNNRSNV